jgi:hypothetical protein
MERCMRPESGGRLEARRPSRQRAACCRCGRLHHAEHPLSVCRTRFAFSYAASASAAFEQECRNYDDFGGSDQLDNDAPPGEPRHEAIRSSSRNLEN